MIPLIMSVLYVWAQLNRDMIVSFWFGTRFKVFNTLLLDGMFLWYTDVFECSTLKPVHVHSNTGLLPPLGHSGVQLYHRWLVRTFLPTHIHVQISVIWCRCCITMSHRSHLIIVTITVSFLSVVNELIGNLVGHLYFFLMFKYPMDLGGRSFLSTPQFLWVYWLHSWPQLPAIMSQAMLIRMKCLFVQL